VLNPAQSTLLAALAPAAVRHRATAISRVSGNAGMGIGAALGGLVAAFGLAGFIALYLVNALTYLVYVVVVIALVRAVARPEPVAGGYRVVLRDRAFLHLALTNVAMITVGWGVFTWLVPPYAKHDIGISTQLIGVLLLANTRAHRPGGVLVDWRLLTRDRCRRQVHCWVSGLTGRMGCGGFGRVFPYHGADAAGR
jgi:MFS family permease